MVWQLGQKRTRRKIRAVKKTSNLDLLEKEIGRLRRSATRLIWLNPLAGSPDYQPLVGGMQTVLPYVDDFYPLNNLHSLEALAAKLSSLV